MTSEEDIAKFRNAALAMRGAEKKVMRQVASELRAVARPVVNQIRAQARASKGTSERGVHASGVARQLHVLSKVREKGAGSIYDPATGLRSERRVRSLQRRLVKAAGLRNAIASAAGSAVAASDKQVSLAFRVSAGKLPPSQRKLPRRWDLPGGWKHPVFGNRSIWVKQVGSPYFRTTVSGARDKMTASVVVAMTAAAEEIMNSEGGAE